MTHYILQQFKDNIYGIILCIPVKSPHATKMRADKTTVPLSRTNVSLMDDTSICLVFGSFTQTCFVTLLVDTGIFVFYINMKAQTLIFTGKCQFNNE